MRYSQPAPDNYRHCSDTIYGETTTVTVTASDLAGNADPLAYVFDCDNDGSFEVGPQADSSAICTFTSPGEFTINVQVSDDDGGVTTGSTVVIVMETTKNRGQIGVLGLKGLFPTLMIFTRYSTSFLS